MKNRTAGRSIGTAVAASVLDTLIDARLLTAYDERGEEDGRRQQIEIIHESLLTAWPRLVRWQTQDAAGAQLRDQLRQAAQAWRERGRPEDLLWSGSAYRDLGVWRERYPGGLSANEDAFTAAAGRRAGLARRRRRLAGAALLVAAATVAVTTSVLWSRSEASRRQAEAENAARRGPASYWRSPSGSALLIPRLRWRTQSGVSRWSTPTTRACSCCACCSAPPLRACRG